MHCHAQHTLLQHTHSHTHAHSLNTRFPCLCVCVFRVCINFHVQSNVLHEDWIYNQKCESVVVKRFQRNVSNGTSITQYIQIHLYSQTYRLIWVFFLSFVRVLRKSTNCWEKLKMTNELKKTNLRESELSNMYGPFRPSIQNMLKCFQCKYVSTTVNYRRTHAQCTHRHTHADCSLLTAFALRPFGHNIAFDNFIITRNRSDSIINSCTQSFVP